MAPNFTVPPAVFARIEHQGQQLMVVKLQSGFSGDPAALGQHLGAMLGLAPDAPLLVLPSEGRPIVGQGPAEQLYNHFISTDTDAVSEQPWQPLPGV